MKAMVSLLEERYRQLKETEKDLHDQKEELQAQKEELTAAIEELVDKNNSLATALESLQQRNNELDQVLYRASHDLKTPVASLYGLLNAMKSEGLNQTQVEIHSRMHQKVDQMNDLLKSLTQLAKASFEPVTVSTFYFQDVFHEVLKELVHLPNFRQVKVSLASNAYKQIRSDRFLVGILLKSLIANAITFRDPTKTGRVLVSYTPVPDGAKITVEDDGEGISDEVSSRVFDIFFRGSERSIGSGLGLYIVQAIVKRLQGTITFISNSGKTTFYVSLPEL